MLSLFEKGIVELIKCALNGGKPKLDDSFDFEEAYEFAQKRQITPILFYGASSLDGFMDTLIGKRFFKSTMNLSFYCAEQSETISSVKSAFNENGIDYLVVKGTILRNLYPYPEMRLMSDADILIREENYEQIRPIMRGLGLVEEYESDHELVWKKGEFTIELHKRLVPSYNKDYYEYFGDGWKIATIKDDNTSEYFMSAEDNFIYNFVHYAMHYRNSGIGVKHVTDFFVMMDNNPELDFNYIETELEKLQLLEFWKNTKKLLDVWFKSVNSDEITDFMTRRIFDSGAYGTLENKLNSEAVRTSNTGKNVKANKMFKVIFPSYKGMCQKYSVLKKAPILLPIMWIVRWLEAIFNPSKIKAQKKQIDMISEESVNKYQSELNYVGLDFNFD
ncbi:MAG: nucleotidyltransferase family protein [Clostridia bacterium]|nr:nucleotidyltransferase family protein [Clostridia bacterium]